MIKTAGAKILLKIVAISFVLVMVISGVTSSIAVVDFSTNSTLNPLNGVFPPENTTADNNPVPLSSNTIYVPDDYTKIQWAVDNASAGDTIIVRDGTYIENVNVNKSYLTIRSENNSTSTIVQAANPDDHVFEVTADYVNISGFTVDRAGYQKAGMYLYDVEHCSISRNNVTNSYNSIRLYGSSNNTITNNNASNNGYGIYLYDSSNYNMLANNTASNNYRGSGIGLAYSSNNTITNNTANSNDNNGISSYYSSNNNTITNNNVSNNIRGISLYESSNNSLFNNTAKKNNYGISLYESSNNSLFNNTANSNYDYGISLSASSSNILTINTMSGNTYNFNVEGSSFCHYRQNIDSSNLVDGKPIYYLVNQQDQQVPNDAGFVGLVNSTNITVKNLTLVKNGCGLRFIQTNDSRIENVTVSNTHYGIYLSYCNNNTIINNNVSNGHYGIYLTDSPYNNIADNMINSCVESGIILDYYPTPGPYLPPVGYNDPDDEWIDEPLAYDEDLDTYAKVYVGNTASPWLELIAPPGKTSQGILFWVNSGDLQVDIYYDGSWHCLRNWNWPYAQAPTNQWVELDYPEETVEKARIRFNTGMMGRYWGHLHEFQFKTTLNISSSNNDIMRNNVSDNGAGIRLYHSSDNRIYLNNFINNTDNGYSQDSSNICNSLEEITYTYNGSTYTNYLGNYWSDYGAYLPPVGHNDPDDEWIDAPLAYDENRDTYARVYVPRVGHGPSSWLELLAPAGETQGVRFWVGNSHLRVDIYYDESWHCLRNWDWPYSEAPTNEWVELNYPSEIVEKARIIFNAGMLGGYWGHLYEFQFKPSNYSGSDANGDGIGDTPYSIDSDKDNYPLMEKFENYFIEENQPPTASFTYSPQNPIANQIITFNASNSTDPDGFITNYEWDFGDGNTSTGEVVTHAYSPVGDYTVNLTVTDDDGAKNSILKVLHIAKSAPKFLTLPFRDPDIKNQQGWIYTWGDIHKAIDYINGTVDILPWESFDVVAAADGVAMWSEQYSSDCGYGKFTLVQHDEKDPQGNNYFTLYAHLDEINPKIVYKVNRWDTNYDTWTPIKRGEFMGKAGSTGACDKNENPQPDWIHLHFEVLRGGYFQNQTDPYDIYKNRSFYPEFKNYVGCGENYLWKTCPPNYYPVADAGTDQSASSGDLVWFDGSNSYDPGGTVVSYEWDFGDGETAIGYHANHRFRGTMNESKNYIVTLTVGDNNGATATDSCDITVTPLEKIVEVTHEPGIPIPGQPVFARMAVSYNWIHDDTYVVSRIHYESGGFIGVGAISIWDFHSYEVPMPKWAADIFSFGGEKEETYSPILEEIHYGGDIFQGIEVNAYDAMNLYIAGWAGISISIGPSLPMPFFETNSACFEPDYTEAPDVPIKAPSFDLAHLCSPGELRVYDSEGRVTGLVNGEIKEEIPYSAYKDNIIIILPSSDSSMYEVAGTDVGSYGLGVASVKDGETNTFTATDIPTSSGAIHQYTIDWDALSQGKEGVTVQVDSDGDGIFEHTFTSDDELTQDEFLSGTTPVPVPEFNAIGLLALVALLTITLALAVRRNGSF